MSSVRLALAFLLLFSAGYIVGSTSSRALYHICLQIIEESWRSGLAKSILVGVGSLSAIFVLLLVLGEKAAAIEDQSGRHLPSEQISAREHLRRRGSF